MEGSGIFKNTFMAEIQTIMEKGQYNGMDDFDPPEEGEEIVGQLADLEKAIFSMVFDKVTKINATCDNCDDTPEDQLSDKCIQIQIVKRQKKVLKNLGWSLVAERLNIHDANLDICENCQIVKLVDQEYAHTPRITIIGVGGG